MLVIIHVHWWKITYVWIIYASETVWFTFNHNVRQWVWPVSGGLNPQHSQLTSCPLALEASPCDLHTLVAHPLKCNFKFSWSKDEIISLFSLWLLVFAADCSHWGLSHRPVSPVWGHEQRWLPSGPWPRGSWHRRERWARSDWISARWAKV